MTMCTRVLVVAICLSLTLGGCASVGGPCSVNTFGETMHFARCEDSPVNPSKDVLQAHAERHVLLGRRFGPFLGPWTAIQRTRDQFRSGGWSGPVEAAPSGVTTDESAGTKDSE